MSSLVVKRSRWVAALAIVAVIFGVATTISGGRTLFDAETQQRAGNNLDHHCCGGLCQTRQHA